MLITYGVCDALDHSSKNENEGGKLGIDVTDELKQDFDFTLLSDDTLLSKMKEISKDIKNLKQYKTNTKNPICIITVDKKVNQKEICNKLEILNKNIRILVIIDEKSNNINYPYMLLWRVVNNIDAQRDIYIYKQSVFIDATNKDTRDDYHRIWPDDVVCTKKVIQDLQKRDLINIDDTFIKQFAIY
jgi:4-hydroxy-3-polyprenylbenzoate decarboxylase